MASERIIPLNDFDKLMEKMGEKLDDGKGEKGMMRKAVSYAELFAKGAELKGLGYGR